ncbi:MAG TPA: MFS transporter [Candidatus Angelobacter sp.]|nr:MFS transporter [Candidatus Angelobacter sp.]
MTDPTSSAAVWTSRRWRIAVLLGVGVLVNFFDRVNLSVAVSPLQTEFGLSTVAIGYLLSAYSWTYIVLQLPSGPVLDRFGVKPVIRISAFLWSLASFATGLARGLTGVISARLLLGVAEAPTFPGNAKAIGVWFPRSERGLATAIFDASAKFASAIGVPIVAVVVHYGGWRMSFVFTGVISLAYFALFWHTYRDPADDPHLSQAEREYITAGGHEEAVVEPQRSASLWYLLRRKKVWGLALGMAAYNYNFYLFLTWLPGYLSTAMHLDVLRSGFFTAIPWLAATVSDLIVGGWLVDYLIRRGRDSTRVRQTILIGGLVMGLAVAGATRTNDPRLAILWIAIALSGLAASAPVGWSIPGLIAPPGSTARVAGIMNFVANLPGVLAPVVTGYLVGSSQSFRRPFLVAAAVLLGGIVSYVLLLGKIETIPGPVQISSR